MLSFLFSKKNIHRCEVDELFLAFYGRFKNFLSMSYEFWKKKLAIEEEKIENF